jgi:hypothetical protein
VTAARGFALARAFALVLAVRLLRVFIAAS